MAEETLADGTRDEGSPLQDSAALLWDESRRQITSQAAELDTLRTRAVAILSVASLVAGLFGGRIVATDHHPGYVTGAIAVALVLFALSVLASIAVLTPRKDKWEFAQYLRSYFVDLKAGDLAPVDITANLAKDFERSRINNKLILDNLYGWFTLACVLVGLQVVAWGIAIL
ncbi:MAG: hypothetical protein ABSC00_00555 [Acidimicrobiales bacterium]|jgi:hypothetical protein